MTGLGSSCGACKFLRRKCTSECVFAPYFCYDEAATHFAAVHKVFGASNASKLLSHLPIHNRSDAAVTISYEALARIRDPIYGCVAHIFALQQQVATLQEEIEILINQMANHAVEIPICGFPQVATYSDGKIELASLHETMSTLYYQDEQTTLPNHPGFIAGNQILDNQLCESLSSPSYEWEEDLNFLFNFYQNPPQLNLEGLESGVLRDNPCMGNSSATTNWEGPNWE